MWSTSIIDEYPTFRAQYGMELLHSLGSVFDIYYLANGQFRDDMHDFARRNDRCFYQLTVHAYNQLQLDNSFDLPVIFNNEVFENMLDSPEIKTEISEENNQYCVPTVHVTPTSIRLMPLEQTRGHRALRHKAFNGANDFCMVYFKPDPPSAYVNKCDGFQRILKSGIMICNFRYHFFGLSNSQLREHSYWFVRATSLEEAHLKRQQLGDFSQITNIGKYAARTGLWFSKSEPTGIELNYIDDQTEFEHKVQQKLMCVTSMDDIERNEYCFTDGNGLISKGLAKLIYTRLKNIAKDEDTNLYPSAYQIRMAGCKGLVIIDPRSTIDQYYIKIRPSMKKFECDDWNVEICETSQPIPTRLNNQIIILMTDLGVPNQTFLELQEKWFHDQKQPPHNILDLMKNKITLPVNECRYMFGCALESRLEPGQCFIQYQVVDDHGKVTEDPKFETVVGEVIVTKNPCAYAGDMIKLQAIDIPELHCFTDVIVFSTKGDRPDCNKIAGSDLDGDHYFIYWGQELKLPTTIEPLEYKTQSPQTHSTSITAQDFINYCFSSLGATTYGEIYNLHAIIVDQNKENHQQRTCQKLAIEMAHMFSAAIDSGKTGYRINQERIRQIRKYTGSVYPDFLMKKSSYPSQSILGILYRRALDFRNQQPNLFDSQDSDGSMISSTNINERKLRFYVNTRIGLNIDSKTIHQELQAIYGDKTPSIITIQKLSSVYQKKQPSKPSWIASSTGILKKFGYALVISFISQMILRWMTSNMEKLF